MSCGSANDCWAVGLAGPQTSDPSKVAIDETENGGSSWRAERVPVPDPTNLWGIACPTRLHCVAVGSSMTHDGSLTGAVLVTTDGGRRWTWAGAPSGSTDVPAVECTTAADCLAVAGQGAGYWAATTTDGGESWQRAGTLPPGFGGPSGVVCTSGQVCMTAGYTASTPGKGSGAIAVSNDGGATWQAAALPPGVGVLHDIACPGTLECIAVGTSSTSLTGVSEGRSNVLVSTDGGSAWTAAPAPDSVDDPFAVACPSFGTCATVGTTWTAAKPPSPEGGVATTSGEGSRWKPARARYVAAGLAAISCPAADRCLAVGNDLLVSIDLVPAQRVTRD